MRFGSRLPTHFPALPDMRTLLTLIGILVLAAPLARAEDWKTTDGKTYQDVKVLSHDDGYVTIMYADGGARVPLSTLAPDLQKRVDYDPAKAAAAVAAATSADNQEGVAWRAQEDGSNSMATAQAPTASQPPSNVVPTQAPLHSTQTNSPAVNVFGNNVKIQQDQQELDGLDEDLRIAQRDAAQEDAWNHTGEMHYDNTGSLHPNRVGASGDERVAEIQKQQAALQAEIADLQKQNQSVTQNGK
jgi:hypothetical protein